VNGRLPRISAEKKMRVTTGRSDSEENVPPSSLVIINALRLLAVPPPGIRVLALRTKPRGRNDVGRRVDRLPTRNRFSQVSVVAFERKCRRARSPRTERSNSQVEIQLKNLNNRIRNSTSSGS
jgi:hypothetical protein